MEDVHVREIVLLQQYASRLISFGEQELMNSQQLMRIVNSEIAQQSAKIAQLEGRIFQSEMAVSQMNHDYEDLGGDSNNSGEAKNLDQKIRDAKRYIEMAKSYLSSATADLHRMEITQASINHEARYYGELIDRNSKEGAQELINIVNVLTQYKTQK